MKIRNFLNYLIICFVVIVFLTACDSKKDETNNNNNDSISNSDNNSKNNQTYMIEYVLNGGVNNPKNPSSYTTHTTSTILYPAITEEIASVFDGWYSTPGFESENKISYISAEATGNITLYAKWINYKIESADEFTFNYVDYDLPRISLTVPNSKSVIALSTAIKVSEGCTWTLSKDVEGLEVIPTKNISLIEGHNKAYVTVWYSENYNLLYEIDIYRLNNFEYSFRTFNNVIFYESGLEENSYVQVPQDLVVEKDYYIFKGWTVDGESLVSFPYKLTANTTFDAVYDPIEYKIEYDLDGGTENVFYPNPEKYSAANPKTFSKPSKSGYTFDGWYYNNIKITRSNDLLGKGDVTLTAKWNKTEYTIDYNLNGGKIDSFTQKFTYDSDDIVIPNPTRYGYEFIGWNVNESEELVKDFVVKSGTTSNQSLNAKWKLINYSITYELDGGTNNINNKTTYNLIDYSVHFYNPSRNGYEFIGWSSSIFEGVKKGISLYFGDGTIECQDFTITANWKPIEYSISYSLNGGFSTGNNPSKYTIEDEVTIPYNPRKKGYTFSGWKMNDEKELISNGKLEIGTYEDLTFVAVWDAYDLTVINDDANAGSVELSGGSCNVWFDLNGGSWNSECYKSISTNEGLKMPSETPVKNGYIFDGWYKGNTKFTFSSSTKIDSDLLLTAHWKDVSSKVYNITGVYTDLSQYDSKDDCFDIKFVGGNYSVLYVTCYSSGTFTLYTKNKYSTSEYSATIKSYYTMENSTAVVKISTSTIDNVDWKGLSISATKDTTYIFEIIPSSEHYETTLSFYISGNAAKKPTTESKYSGIVNNSNVTAGEVVSLKATPKTNYEFAGWYKGNKLLALDEIYTFEMPNENIEIYAKWKQLNS